jgi:hypothetical protein
MCSLRLVVRKFQFVICGFFVMYITSVTALEIFDLMNENKIASMRCVENIAGHPYFLGVDGVVLVESHLVKRLGRRTKGLINLQDT